MEESVSLGQHMPAMAIRNVTQCPELATKTPPLATWPHTWRSGNGRSIVLPGKGSGVQARGDLALSPLKLDRWIAESINRTKPEAEW